MAHVNQFMGYNTIPQLPQSQGGPKPGTSLHYAGGNLRPEIIGLLVKNGLDLDQKFEHGICLDLYE